MRDINVPQIIGLGQQVIKRTEAIRKAQAAAIPDVENPFLADLERERNNALAQAIPALCEAVEALNARLIELESQ